MSQQLSKTRARTVALLTAQGMCYDPVRDICYWEHGKKGGTGRIGGDRVRGAYHNAAPLPPGTFINGALMGPDEYATGAKVKA